MELIAFISLLVHVRTFLEDKVNKILTLNYIYYLGEWGGDTKTEREGCVWARNFIERLWTEASLF